MRLSVPARWLLAIVAVAYSVWVADASIDAARADAAERRASEHMTWGRLDAARAELEGALAAAPHDAELYRSLAAVDEAIFRFRRDEAAAERAIRAYAEAIELNPLDAGARVELGWANLRAGRLAAADRAFSEAIARDPNNAYLLASFGYLRELQGRPADAADLYRRSLALAPDRDLADRLDRMEGE